MMSGSNIHFEMTERDRPINYGGIGASKPVNRCKVYVEGSGDVGNGFVLQHKPSGQPLLVDVQFARASEAHASL